MDLSELKYIPVKIEKILGENEDIDGLISCAGAGYFGSLENFSVDKINYLHYYNESNYPITNKIDYSKGYISRTPDHDNRVKNPFRPMSIVVDCYK